MISVVQIDGIEQASPLLELGAFCNGECRGTEFPAYDEGQWLYFMTIGGNEGDEITFRLYDHALQQELNLYCYNVLPFEVYGLIGIDEPYEILFASTLSVSANVNPENAGTIEGEGEYSLGAEATLTATANEGYLFNSWTLDGEVISTEPSYTFTVTEPMSFTANFDVLYSVSISVNMEEAGTVTGEGWYLYGTSVTVAATPNEGYVFNSWTLDGEVVSTDPTYTFTVTAPVSLMANFDVLYSVSISINMEEAGTVTGEGEYLYGTNVTVTATPNEGYAFNSWTLNGEIVSTEPSYSFTVTNTMNFIANFEVWYPVSATVSPDNAGAITGTGEYLYGTDVTLTATPNEGYAFNSWTLDGEVVSTEPSYTFTVTAPVSLMANFDVLYSVSISINMEEAGTVTGEGEYLYGTSVTVAATANEGYAFNSWTLDGEIVSTEPSYSFTVTSAMNFIANFDALYSVSATVNLENAGTIVGTGIYVSGTEATLIATANEGYAFNSWTLNGEVVSIDSS